MSVWYCIPSARPASEAQACVDAWRAMGYCVAVWRDIGADLLDCDYSRYGEYPGYARAVNALAADVLAIDTACDWIVTGGDDVFPDKTKLAEEIAAGCSAHFRAYRTVMLHSFSQSETYGVMQPTGDRFADGSIDRIAGSPWMGREWCQRAHGGTGPLHQNFTHMHVDEALQGAAMAQGVFWQRPDLTQLHRHFMRESDDINSPAVGKPIPAHLVKANSAAHWNESKSIFERIKRGGFAECLPV